ncbi:hypothetical protein JTE90_004119 [Oedothorax gibbosus]|uniref:BTB domain-containing protein n=1 Tax=Oedothorax gibbosus TaxID=931172 RepID=A0AAV6V1V2_9ARAC|nr:hypothetical protein JTE90_004119 [Oedothorax gibbosus]
MAELNNSPDESRKTTQNFCTTVLQKSLTSMEWCITNFELLQACNITLESSSFKSENGLTGTWKLRLVTSINLTERNVGLYAVCSERPDYAYVDCNICVVGAEGMETNVKKISSVLKTNNIDFPDFITKFHLGDMLQNGNLTVRCSITVTTMNKTETICSGQLDLGKNLSNDFSNLLMDEFLSDITLVCGEKQFLAHKCVLSARSPVFKAMFTHDLKENQLNSVEITDIESEALEHLLTFIYTDKIFDDLNADMTIGLLRAADKYQLSELKIHCGKHLKKQLSLVNFSDLANIADIYDLDGLKNDCIEFVLERNAQNLFSENLVTGAPRYLIEEVLKKVLPDVRNIEEIPKEKLQSTISHFGRSAETSTGFSFAQPSRF